MLSIHPVLLNGQFFHLRKPCIFYQRNGQRPLSGTRLEMSLPGRDPVFCKHPKAGPTCRSFVGAEGVESVIKQGKLAKNKGGPPFSLWPPRTPYLKEREGGKKAATEEFKIVIPSFQVRSIFNQSIFLILKFLTLQN